MRVRSMVVAVALLLPSLSFAQQRAPRIGGGRPGQPVPLGREPEVVARSQALTRSRYSVEAYPLISRVVSSGFANGIPGSSWTSFGSGTRLDWRLTRYLSWTADLTASFLGGAATTETAEVGARIGEQNWDNRLRPFADVRVGFEHSFDSGLQQELGIGPASGLSSGSRYSRGFGGVVGAGADYSFTNTFALTTAVSAMRSNMTAYRITGVSVPTVDPSFRVTTYRLTVGLKYNPVHMIRSSNNLH